jgi:Mn-dependent DtxR family transcriptional regulator
MNYSKPSVCRAVGLLKKNGYITVDKNGYINLTDAGIERANKIFERHTVLTDFLISLGINKETADNDACRMEHIISEETFNALKNYLKKDNL